MTRNLRTIGKMVLSSLLLSTALAACTVGLDYTRPKTGLAPFHNAAYVSPAQGQVTPPLDRWWTGFNDPMPGHGRAARVESESRSRRRTRSGTASEGYGFRIERAASAHSGPRRLGPTPVS
jgi:hypothetical protein